MLHADGSEAGRRTLQHAVKHLLASKMRPHDQEALLDTLPHEALAPHVHRMSHFGEEKLARFGPPGLPQAFARAKSHMGEHGLLRGAPFFARAARGDAIEPGQVEVLWEGSPTALFNADTLVTLITCRAVVRRHLSDIAAILNPVRWAISSPESFDASYRVAQRDDGSAIFEGNSETPKPADPQPAPFEGWEGIMFEDYVMSYGSMDLFSFQNLLNIDYRTPWGNAPRTDLAVAGRGAPPYVTLEFDLGVSLSSSMGLTQRGGGLDVDSGGALVIPLMSPDLLRPIVTGSGDPDEGMGTADAGRRPFPPRPPFAQAPPFVPPRFRRAAPRDVPMTSEQLHDYEKVWAEIGRADPLPDVQAEMDGSPTPDFVGTWYVEVTKSVRFTNMLRKVASGQIMNPGYFMDYNAPAICSAWMGEVIREGVCAPLRTSTTETR
jgi:hypothetical protein